MNGENKDNGKGKFVCYDGNRAAATVAYAMSDIAFIYPITPSSPMAELADSFATEGRKNVFGQPLAVTQMQSEGGAAGALHGGAASGALVTTFTASQGLLLMIPDLYKLAGELLPAVLHVAARQISASSSSIFAEHSDVMAARTSGVAILSSHSVQDCMDYAAVAHVASLRASLPVLHFFDGFHLSHELAKIREIPTEVLASLVSHEDIQRHRNRASHPAHPTVYGTLQGRDSLFQGAEAGSRFYDAAPEIFDDVMKQISRLTGRQLSLFEYVGPNDADRVIAMMGAGSGAAVEAAKALNVGAAGERVGVLRVHLFRPWSPKHFLAALPSSVRAIAVLDRTMENGAAGDPLYLDVASSVLSAGLASKITVVGGRFGLGDKAFTPAMAKAVFDNLAEEKPMSGFTVGIDDDVRHKSLVVGEALDTVPKGTQQSIFWGFGSDGTVGATRLAVDLIAANTDLYAQGYFFFTAHKAGGVTTSHLRFGPSPITSTYPISSAGYVAVHHPAYLAKFAVADALANGGHFVVNCSSRDTASFACRLPPSLRRKLASCNARVHVIDAYKISKEAGLGGHINGVMQAVFFALSGVLPVDKAVALLKDSVVKAYRKKGDEVVRRNVEAIDSALAGMIDISYNKDEWASSQDVTTASGPELTPWVKKMKPVLDKLQGDRLPVSAFTPGGATPTATTWQEKRSIATQVPRWNATTCVQCNMCAALCPHAAIRPFLFEEQEAAHVPEGMTIVDAKALPSPHKEKKLKFRIQVSAQDCTGCGVCARACPVKDALTMVPVTDDVLATERNHWDHCMSLPVRNKWFESPANFKMSQFRQPLFEFSAACAGCGEAAYIKLLTQLFGERMVVSNAAGCSSAISVTYGSCPYCVSPDGWGPALRVSLFEENAEFGFGMMRGQRLLREQLRTACTDLLADAELCSVAGEQLCALIHTWLADFEESEKVLHLAKEIIPLIPSSWEKETARQTLAQLHRLRDAFVKVTFWTMGGDGWAYDIDFGGLDHVLSQGAESRVIVLDTEVYSNTGGQVSKATPEGGIHKFAAGGKERAKKDLAAIAMSYGHIYVAQINLDANPQQAMRALMEADTFPGPALLLCYAPCIEHGIEGGSEEFVAHAKLATSSGYWPLFRFNPTNPATKGKPALEIDAPSQKACTAESIAKGMQSFMATENRFARLKREQPERAAALHKALCDRVASRWNNLKHRLQQDDKL